MIEQALALARQFEGLRLKPYLCPAGVPTIGYGSTRDFGGRRITLASPPITVAIAEELLIVGMRSCAASVLRLCPTVADSPGRLSALSDFVYNLGAGRLQYSTLKTRVNARDWNGATHELRRWVHGGGHVLPGLVLRREAEIVLLPA